MYELYLPQGEFFSHKVSMKWKSKKKIKNTQFGKIYTQRGGRIGEMYPEEVPGSSVLRGA